MSSWLAAGERHASRTCRQMADTDDSLAGRLLPRNWKMGRRPAGVLND